MGNDIRALEHAVVGFEMMGEPRRQAFEQAAERYVNVYHAHTAMEEEQAVAPFTRIVSMVPAPIGLGAASR